MFVFQVAVANYTEISRRASTLNNRSVNHKDHLRAMKTDPHSECTLFSISTERESLPGVFLFFLVTAGSESAWSRRLARVCLLCGGSDGTLDATVNI